MISNFALNGLKY